MKRPVSTISILSATVLAAVLQADNSRLLPLLERAPEMFSRHQYWRLVTPLFMHTRAWEGVCNFVVVAVLGVMVERMFGSKLWLVLFFTSGIVGEIAGHVWKPVGAGSSVAAAGLLGAIAAWLLFRNRRPQGVFGALVIVFGAIALTALRDLHGPPILVGFCIASLAVAAQSRATVRPQADELAP